jgi:SsrA-binding protein
MGVKIICQNRKAKFDYEILEKIEGGIMLTGSEVKSLRDGKGNLVDSYAQMKKNELWLLKAHIAHYPAANQLNHEETRERKILLHRREIDRLMGKMQEKGLTLIPLSLYFKEGRVKVELGLGRGKKAYDKRETKKKQETDRDMARVKKAMK